MTLAKLERKTKTLDISVGSQVGTERIRGSQLYKIRERIALRDIYACQVCGRVIGLQEGQVDHKIPLHLGGAESDDNRQWLCPECHAKKSDQEEKGRQGCTTNTNGL